MRKDAIDCKKAAHDEGKKSEYERLVGHLKKTEDLYNSRFAAGDEDTRAMAAGYGGTGGGGASGGGGGMGGGGGNNRGVTQLDTEMSSLSHPMVNLRDDEEFQVFFEQTQKNDQIIDQHLDRLSAGVQVLQQNATQINQELKVQSRLLDETETKVDKVHTDLVTVNKKLSKTLKSVKKDKLCIYLVCFILLFGLCGAIYFMIAY